MRVLIRQIAKEFWLPFACSLAWVAYSMSQSAPPEEWRFKDAVNIFAPSFFLLSWATGQFFRVKKQSRVEDSFGKLEQRFGELLTRVEEKTKEMISHVSGGESFPVFNVGNLNDSSNDGVLMVTHHGEFPLYDVHARIVDLQKFDRLKDSLNIGNLHETHKIVNVGNMIPSHTAMLQPWKLEGKEAQSYNIFITARNGALTEKLRFRRAAGKWVRAVQVLRKSSEVIYEEIDPGYPREEGGGVSWE